MQDPEKLIGAKTALAQSGGQSSTPGSGRIPPGQKLVSDFPVLDLGIKPEISREQWRLRLFGLVEQEVTLSWMDLLALPQTRVVSDFHCVTRWTRLDLEWEGVLAREVVALARPLPQARFVTLHGEDGYTTNLPLAALLDDVMLAHSVGGQPLAAQHGGPVRMVVPKRYGWKSAKWLNAIEFHEYDRPGFWEQRGYHNDADPWQEQRYAPR